MSGEPFERPRPPVLELWTKAIAAEYGKRQWRDTSAINIFWANRGLPSVPTVHRQIVELVRSTMPSRELRHEVRDFAYPGSNAVVSYYAPRFLLRMVPYLKERFPAKAAKIDKAAAQLEEKMKD